MREYFYYVSKTQKTMRNIAVQMHWFRPPVDWFKLNSDGKWVKGYMRLIGFASNIIAKFWVLKDGLLLASQLGIS